jgi:hypothetical protein
LANGRAYLYQAADVDVKKQEIELMFKWKSNSPPEEVCSIEFLSQRLSAETSTVVRLAFS